MTAKRLDVRTARSFRKDATGVVVYCPYCEDKDVVVEKKLENYKVGYFCPCCNNIFLVSKLHLKHFGCKSL